MEKRPSECAIGINALTELLRHFPERIQKVFVGKSEEVSVRKQELIQELEKQGIPFDYARKETLNSYAGTDSHQGFVALLKKRPYLELGLFLQDVPDKALILAVDSVFDPHNFGAILRAAECFGVAAVLWSKNRGVGITPVVSKTSSGASEIVSLLRVANLASALGSLKEKGFSLIAADIDEKAESLHSFSFPDRSVLIMGSEGEGIQPLIKKMVDHTVFIPMQGKISSLNVSQAAAALLSHWRLQDEAAATGIQ